MTDSQPPLPPPPKPTSPQDWDSLIDDFLNGGSRRRRWRSHTDLLDHVLSFLLKKDFPLKLSLLLLLEEFSDSFFAGDSDFDRLLESLRSVVQAPPDSASITLLFKEQFLVSATSIFISVDALGKFDARFVESLVEFLLTVINRPNHGSDRQTRGVACECLRQLEKCYPCLLSAVGGHLWSLCQSERTHACQCYLLLFTNVVYNIVDKRLNVSILNTSVPLVPFNVPQWVLGLDSSSGRDVTDLNHKELKRAMSFLLEAPQVLTPSGMVEFLSMIMPVTVILELQASLLKVQFFGMIYSFNPSLCHAVLVMYRHFSDAFDGQEEQIARRLMLVSRETQHNLVFRLLVLHWLLGLLSKFVSNREAEKYKAILEMCMRFYPEVFDPLALKAMKLDLLAFSAVCLDKLKSGSDSSEEVTSGKTVVKLFENAMVSVSSFKWLPPWSTETVVAFRAFHKFLLGASLLSAASPSSNRIMLDNKVINTLQGMLVSMTMEFQRFIPIFVSFIDRLLACQNHRLLGENLLQTVDEYLLTRDKLYHKLASYFPIFERIAETNTIPPHGLLDLLLKYMVFLVQKNGPNTRLRSWSSGSKVLCICRTMLMHHHSSRLFVGLSRLLSFTCLYFPDLEVRDNARIYLRMLICIPGAKLKSILNFGEQLIGISPSPHPSSFYNDLNLKKSRSISSYIHLDRIVPLLVKQSWSLSLSPLGFQGSNKPSYLESVRDTEPQVESSEILETVDPSSNSETDRILASPEPLRVMDSKIAGILDVLRRHFSCIPDFRHMPGLKVSIPCSLRFDSASFNQIWGSSSPTSQFEGIDSLPALYATVLKFSSSAPYGSIPPRHIPFLLGEPPRVDDSDQALVSLDNVSEENGIEDEETFKALVTVDLEPREPTPGLVDVLIETNTDNGQIVNGQLRGVTVGIEDMFLKTIAPHDIPEEEMPSYYSELFDALWEACDTSSNLGRETFLLKGGKGVAAICGTRSVKLLEVPGESLIRAIEQHLTSFVVGVMGEQLVNIVKDRGVIRDVIWKDDEWDPTSDTATPSIDLGGGPLRLAYNNDEYTSESEVNISRRHMGCILILIFLPPRFHLLFQMEVSDLSTLVRIRTDHWPCLAYVDDYLEALFIS